MTAQTIIGERYRLDELIGRGGMATVWRATDTVLNRPVAVKRLHASLVADEELTERFRREALMVARLSHPNLVHVLDRGEDGDGPFLVLELVEGENLKARIRRDGPLEPAEATRICAQVAQALHYAHTQGLVHRDIKAQNVLLAEDGSVKLADFGIARALEADEDTGLTRTDMLMGSADYLSPEQANGHPLDARSDIYSLGVVLFECLTGTLPFSGDGFVAVAMKHCSEPLPDPRDRNDRVPTWLAAIVLRATAKDPAARFPDAAALVAALGDGPPTDGGTAIMPIVRPADTRPPTRDSAGDDTATARRPRRPNHRRRLAAIAVLIVVVAGAAVAGGLRLAEQATEGPPPPTKPSAAVTDLTIASISDVDPTETGGDGAENPGQRDLAIDGDPATAWYTEKYQDSPRFGGLKEGVGLLVHLARPAVVREALISSPTAGATFEIRSVAPGGQRPLLGSGTFTGTAQKVPLTTAPATQNVLLWITSLAPTGDGRYQAGVGEIRLRGVPASATE